MPLDRAGRVVVNPDLTVPEHPEAFVVGDLASLMQDGAPVPGVAAAAVQEARHAGANIRSPKLRGEPLAPFRYRDKGSLATIGRSAGGRRTSDGSSCRAALAWLAWLLLST